MGAGTEAIIRAYDGSLADAEGILAVERATFDESPYTAAQVQSQLTGGGRQAWLAVQDHEVAGFVVAFLTHGLGGSWWEVDLLAVHPSRRGLGLAARLVRAAAHGGARMAARARAAVAADNLPSQRAFARNAFHPVPEPATLLILRPQGQAGGQGRFPGVQLREAASRCQAAAWLAEIESRASSPGSLDVGASAAPAPVGTQAAFTADTPSLPGLTLLLAEQAGRAAGAAELIEVQTLLYRGIWIESLVAPSRRVREALIAQAVHRAVAAGMDEIGAMVTDEDWPLQHALLAAGFRSLGVFGWWQADLPLPDSAGGIGPEEPDRHEHA